MSESPTHSSGSSAIERQIAQWERTVSDVEGGYPLTFDDYLNDLDLRRILSESAVSQRQADRLEEADKRFRAATFPAGECLWGRENALAEGWTAEQNWYYWRLPLKAGSAFKDEGDFQ